VFDNLTKSREKNLSLLQVKGEDYVAFLNNLFALDLTKMPDKTGSYGSWLNHQGKVKFTFSIFHLDESLIIATESADRVLLSQELKKYKLRSKVEINNCDDAYRHCYCENDAQQLLADASFKIFSNHNITSLIFKNNSETLEIYRNIRTVNSDQLIKMGLPIIGEANKEKFNGVFLKLAQFNAISNSKGCYPGQEIVNKLSRKKNMKQSFQLFRLENDPNKDIKAGDEIISENHFVGHVVNVTSDNYLTAMILDHNDKSQKVVNGLNLEALEFTS